MQFGNTNYYLYLVAMSTGINWAYTDKKQADRARLAMQQKSKKVKPNVKPKTKKQTYKVKELIWFISPVGHNVVPSPMEDVIRNILNGFEIEFATEVSFNGLNPKGGIGGYLRFDFYIPSIKVAIEYQGKEYHQSEDVKKRDRLKYLFCKDNAIKLHSFTANDVPTLYTKIQNIVKTKKPH